MSVDLNLIHTTFKWSIVTTMPDNYLFIFPSMTIHIPHFIITWKTREKNVVQQWIPKCANNFTTTTIQHEKVLIVVLVTIICKTWWKERNNSSFYGKIFLSRKNILLNTSKATKWTNNWGSEQYSINNERYC